ncbi:MFS transporter [Dyadobacter arcticus]|uniref:DHA3 family multidrug efflux protein-like MFS transporter n=1 Tax=Dyadobacter arcticus TaxID=1078754 RepID=A0ABX0UPL3_9BACT|nr:MFS transporter [Dyadobacter arcticus]NIJ53904.1 DHA3 family multidrug efflux protein-like MFS transporter [Dyadobacter arcticus]
MKTFYAVLANSLAASLTNNFVWFAVTFWVYLETKSVIATSVMAGVYLATVAFSGFFLGSIVDRYKKKTSMMISGVLTLLFYTIALVIYLITPDEIFRHDDSVSLWTLVILCLFGAITGNIRSIALSTVVTILVEEDVRDKANGMVGTVNGVAFLISSIFSGLVIGFLGILWMLILASGLTILVLLHLLTITIPEKGIVHTESHFDSIDIRGTIRVVGMVPGLFGLIFFNTFNNFLGGVFMSLMDAYGLSMVSVQTWGILWGVLSLGFIIGGIVVAKKGLGKMPLRTLFLSNIVMWCITIIFPIQASIVLLGAGMFAYLCLIPVVEATEQTILQKVIPHERQGRVFGFAQSVEQAASPMTAFMIGPIAKFIFIPFMTTGAGANLIGSWFGTGTDRGLALLFIVTGIVGLLVTLLAMQSGAYQKLSNIYRKAKPELDVSVVPASGS